MPVVGTKAAASSQGFGEFAQSSSVPNYIEDVFSTYLYTGNGSSQTITNNINLSGKGGMVWIKDRTNAYNNNLFDTVQGATKVMHSNTTDAQTTDAASLTAFSTTGFTLGTGSTSGSEVNSNTDSFVSWSFRKQPKFFDIVTYTGNSANRTIAHNLGSVPGCIIVKRTDAAGYAYQVYHQNLSSAAYSLSLNSVAAEANNPSYWNSTAPTDTVFSLGTSIFTNVSGGTFVAYVIASDAGGFGLAGTDNVISCGNFVGSTGAAIDVNIGYEPQLIIYKNRTSNGNWTILDNMRGWSVAGNTAILQPNTTAAETNGSVQGYPTATGFHFNAFATVTANYIYIAIRRGPMKVPTDGTKVFDPVLYVGNNSTTRTFTSSTVSPVDSVISLSRNGFSGSGNIWWVDRLRGNAVIRTDYTDAETGAYSGLTFDFQNGYANNAPPSYYGWNNTSDNCENYFLKRAPGFFDEVCDSGTGSAHTVTHNLGAVPELIIRKGRSGATQWEIYSSALTNTEKMVLNSTAAKATDTSAWNSTTPTSSVFTVGTGANVNTNAATYVTYLFASCPGVSKVGSYTGNGTTQAIACGFTGGARFVLIKRTDSTGDWYVYDTARGMTVMTDPYLLLNSTAAETATLGSVITSTGGFTVNAAILAAVNTNAASYIFLAIA